MAKLLADEMTSNGQVIGIGTGVAVNEYLREISERLGDGRLSVSKFQYYFLACFISDSRYYLFSLFMNTSSLAYTSN